MGQRRKARESALQILYQLEFDETDAGEAHDAFWRKRRAPAGTKDYCRRLVEGISSYRNEIDEAIQSISEHWRIARMALIDRNILRLAAFELLHAGSIPPAIVINEAIEIAKKYSGPEAATFVNGILDALRKKIKAEANPEREVKHVRKDRREGKSDSRRRAQKD
ncbi:MAG: transcription antitermination factor NusB [Candidatus Aminicenantales bacterium]